MPEKPVWRRLSETTERTEYLGFVLQVSVRRRWGTAPSQTYWELRDGPRILKYGSEKEPGAAKEVAQKTAENEHGERIAKASKAPRFKQGG